MVNRTMQAKSLKIKRRRFKMRTKSAGPYPGWASDYYRRVSSFRKPFCERIDDIPQTLGPGGVRVDVGGASVLTTVLEGMRNQPGTQVKNSFVLASSTQEQVRMFFSGNSFFLTHEVFHEHIVRRSIIYPTKDRAYKAYKAKRVTWVERSSTIPNPPAMTPPVE